MRETWFRYPDCTIEEAEELMRQYHRRGVSVEKSLNHDFIKWTVSALLPEYRNKPKQKEQCWYLR